MSRKLQLRWLFGGVFSLILVALGAWSISPVENARQGLSYRDIWDIADAEIDRARSALVAGNLVKACRYFRQSTVHGSEEGRDQYLSLWEVMSWWQKIRCNNAARHGLEEGVLITEYRPRALTSEGEARRGEGASRFFQPPAGQ